MSLIDQVLDDVNANNLRGRAMNGLGFYGDGAYRWDPAAVASFEVAKKTCYWCTGAPAVAGPWVNARDCEPGNGTPLDAAHWLYDELHSPRAEAARLYAMSAWWSALIAEVQGLGITPLDWDDYQVAHYDGVPALPSTGSTTAKSKQYASLLWGDISIMDPTWYGATSPTAVAPGRPCVTPKGVTLAGHICSISSLADGYWLTGTDGGVFALNHPYDGGMGGKGLVKPIVDILAHQSGGYWLIAADGGVFAFGDAPYEGSAAAYAPRMVAPIMGGAATSTGKGYWLVGGDGGVFAFGDAVYYGHMAVKPVGSIVALMPTPDDGGYWLVGSDGGIFSYGNAGYHGGMAGKPLAAAIVDGAAMPDGQGYVLFGADGGIFPFGSAQFLKAFTADVAGDAGAGQPGWPVVGGAVSRDGKGYAVVTANGAVLTAGDAQFQGSL